MTEINIKLLLVGDSCVGKTSLLLQYTEEIFPNKHIATVGVEYKIKMIKYKDFKLKLQIWDTAGQERFHSITKNFFHNADGILFVFDITNKNSFAGVKNWIKEAEEVGNDFQKILIGNKCDLNDERSVSIEEVKNYCKTKEIFYFETSAKNNINLKEVFDKIVELIFKEKTDDEIISEFGLINSSLSIISNSSKKENKSNKNKNNKVSCC